MRRVVWGSVLVLTASMVTISWWREGGRSESTAARLPAVAATTRQDLQATIAAMEKRIGARDDDGDAVVRLADALIRRQRVDNDAKSVIAAESHLRKFLSRVPEHYEGQRMLAAVLLSQHRFRDALREARRAQTMEPRDAWNYGVIGDAHLELGDYDAAFEAFDRMGTLRPGPPAYARVAYALEMKGDLEGALASMRMATEGTSAHDAEGQAWHYAQLGHLLLQTGRLGDARREFERAALTFPDHPYAMTGLARIKLAERDHQSALILFTRLFEKTPSPELAFVIGDLHARLGQPGHAEARYEEGERLEREGWATEEPQPQALARFLAERGRKIPAAISWAEEAAAKRRDVHTMDALAWSYYKAGRFEEARRASDEAIRTGTRDARLLYHAAEIRARLGDREGARRLRERAAVPLPEVVLADPASGIL